MLSIVLFDISAENIGVQILSALLKKNNYNCDIVFELSHHLNPIDKKFSNEKESKIIEKILSHKPDIVGFSAFTDTFQVSCQIAKGIKKKNKDITTIFGGFHPTIMGKEILKNDFIDFSIVGEGEYAFLEFLYEYQNSKNYYRINNLCFKSNGEIICNPVRPFLNTDELDALPFPEKDIYLKSNKYSESNYLILTSRGCAFNCSYCSYTAIKRVYKNEKQYVRRRSPGNVIYELLIAREKYDIGFVRFIDDVFTYDSKWLEIFSKIYRDKINLPSECLTHPELINEKIGDMLEQLNMKIVTLGVQTVDEKYRKQELHRYGSNRQIEDSIEILKKRKIKIALNHILDLPNETIESVKESIKLYSKWKPTTVAAFKLTYYPKTDIVNTARQSGMLTDSDLKAINEGKYASTATNSQNIHDSFSDRSLRFAILIRSIGFLPGPLIRFLTDHINLVTPNKYLYQLVSIYPRWILQRQKKNNLSLIFSLLFSQTKNLLSELCVFFRSQLIKPKKEIMS